MRRRILGAVLALMLVLSATARPAFAEGEDTGGNQYYQKFVDILISLLDKGRDGSYTAQEIAELVQQLIGATNAANVDLLTRLDNELTNDIKGQAQAALTKVEMLRRPETAGVALNSIHDAAHRAMSHIGTVRHSDVALDAVGKAMITLFTELDTAYTVIDADEGTTFVVLQRRYFRLGLENLIREMNTDCYHGGLPSAGLATYTCYYGGDSARAEFWAGSGTYTINGGPPITGAIDYRLVEETLMRGTARPLAQQALDNLIRAGVTLP